MAEATTRPARSRATKETPVAGTPRKAAPAATAPVAAPANGSESTNRINLVYTHEGDTKNYAKFVPPADSGVTGTIYAPLGTVEVKAVVILG